MIETASQHSSRKLQASPALLVGGCRTVGGFATMGGLVCALKIITLGGVHDDLGRRTSGSSGMEVVAGASSSGHCLWSIPRPFSP